MNTVTIGTTLAIAITCMIIGFVTGGAIGYFNNPKRKNKKEEDTPQAPTPASQAVAPIADPAKYTELLHLWRDKKGNGLCIETSGHLLATSQPLNIAQKNRFLDLIKELAIWLDVPVEEAIPQQPARPVISYDHTVEPGKTAAGNDVLPSHDQKESLVKASEPVKTNPLSPAPVPPIPSTPNPSISIQANTPPAIPNSVPPLPARSPVEPIKKAAGSMVEQIDEILQEIISLSDNPSRRIKLMEEKQEGVIVWVGQEHFIGIDAVTDQSAKDLIRAAVKEWDRRTETRK